MPPRTKRKGTASGRCQHPSEAPDIAGHSEHQTPLPFGRISWPDPCEEGREQPGASEHPGHSENRTQRKAGH
eukprot:14268186-Alexandrium_andersonii.AAC.1